MRHFIIRLLNVSDQLLLTFWSFLLTFIFANIFSKYDFVGYSLYYTIQAIALLLLNSTYGQMLILEGRNYSFRSIQKKNLVFCLSLFLLLLILLVFDVIELRQFGFFEKIIFSFSITLFCYFELTRRFLYSLNQYKLALWGVIRLLILLSLTLLLLSFFHVLEMKNFLIVNSLSYILAIIYFQFYINKIPTSGKASLNFSSIFDFTKWLVLGVLAYIISDKLFIFYLNSKNELDQVIGFRLIESIMGLILVFIVAFENFFISNLKVKKLKDVLMKLTKTWLIFLLGLILVVPFLDLLLTKFFHHKMNMEYHLLIVILMAYELLAISRAFVVYVRLNKFNKTIFLSNLFSSAIVILVFMLDVDLDLYQIFWMKSIFPVTNIFIYLVPYFRYEKKNFNLTRFWS